MRQWILLVLCLLCALSMSKAREYEYQDTISVSCVQAQSISFKVMREFTLVLSSPPLTPQQTVILSKNSVQVCRLTSELTVCTFNGMVREIGVTCPPSLKLALEVIKPEILPEKSTVRAGFVEVSGEDFERGVVDLLLEGDVGERVRNSKTGVDIAKKVLAKSSCVKFVALFEDVLKIALEKQGNAGCIFGLKQGIEGSWIYHKTGYGVEELGTTIHDYAPKFTVRVYQIPQLNNYTLEVLVESDDSVDTGKLYVSAGFKDARGAIQYYLLTNFQKGIDPFRSELFHNQTAVHLVLMSNFDVFIAFSFNHSTLSNLNIEDEEYLFTKFNNKSQFILELDEFDNQKQAHRTLKLFNSIQAPKNIKFDYAQCSETGTNCTQAIAIPSTRQFQPKCQHLVGPGLCYIKIFTKNIEMPTVFGILPHIPIQQVQIALDSIHHGTLQSGAIVKFVLSAQSLSNLKFDEITIVLSGVRAYLTYDSNCRRIACAEYQVTANHKGIPNLKKDLHIMLEGTSIVRYYFSIRSSMSAYFDLKDGIPLQGKLLNNTSFDYYTFNIANKEAGLEIKCNAPSGLLELFLNVDSKEFPTTKNLTHNSSDCYIYLSKNQIKVLTQNTLHIAVHRRSKQHGNINYDILAVTDGHGMTIKPNHPYSEFLQAKSQKVYIIPVQNSSMSITGLVIKVDVIDADLSQTPIKYSVGNSSDYLYNSVASDVSTLAVDHEKWNELCKWKSICDVRIKLTNTQSVPVRVQLLVWMKSKPIRLPEGRSISFNTGSTGEATNFYAEITKDTPINIFAYSTEVNIKLRAIVSFVEPNLPENKWPFPLIQKSDEQQLNDPPNFSKFVYFTRQDITNFLPTPVPEQQKQPQDPDQQSTQNQQPTKKAYLLLTMKDYSHIQNKAALSKAQKGTVQIMYATDQIEMAQSDKMQYILNENQTFAITYDISQQSRTNKTNHQLYLNNIKLSGESTVSIKFFGEQLGHPITDIYTTPINSDTVIVELDKINKKILAAKSQYNLYSLKLLIKCEKGQGQFFATLSASDSQFRSLTLGLPEPFYIRKNSSVVFQFMDYYNSDFTIKINRKQGFPHYKIVSCKASVSQFQCLKELDEGSRNIEDPQHVVAAGRSHQLFINRRSEVYCKECRYYIGFFSYNQEIKGSVTITRQGNYVTLATGQPLTTQVYSNETDAYIVSIIPKTEQKIIIIPHFGKLKVSLASLGKQIQIDEAHVIETDPIEMPLTTTQNQILGKLIYIKSFESDSAMYTILLGNKKSSLMLEDGMPYTLTNKPGQISEFSFDSINDSTLIVFSNTTINVDVSCPETVYEVVEPKGSAEKAKFASSLPANRQVNPTNLKKLRPQISLLTNISTVQLKSGLCPKYGISVHSEKEAKYTLVVSGSDYVFLPPSVAMPGVLEMHNKRVYQIPITEKVQLKIVLRLCQQGQVSVGLTYDLKDLAKQDFDQSFDISSNEANRVIKYKARPGILYISVKAFSHDISYTIEVFPFHTRQEQKQASVHLEDRYVNVEVASMLDVSTRSDTIRSRAVDMAEKIVGDVFYYELVFAPLQVDSTEIDYKVSYFLIESSSRQDLDVMVRCRGAFMKQGNPEEAAFTHQGLLETQTTKKIVNSGSKLSSPTNENVFYLRAKYKSKESYSFAAIIPVVTPPLPGHIPYQSYQTVILSGGEGSLWFMTKRAISSIFYYLRGKTGIKSPFIIGFLTSTVICFTGIGLAILIFYMLKFFQVSVATSARFYRRTPLATSERDSRLVRQPENALGMLETSQAHLGPETAEKVAETTVSQLPVQTQKAEAQPGMEAGQGPVNKIQEELV